VTIETGVRETAFTRCMDLHLGSLYFLCSPVGEASCTHIADFLAEVGFVPDTRAEDHCVVFDADVYNGKALSDENEKRVSEFCGVRSNSRVLMNEMRLRFFSS
jgi:hypothetical protein